MAEEATTETVEKSGKSAALKAILLVAAILMIEAGTILGTMWLSGGPSEVKGEGIAADLEAERNRLVEVLVIEDRFINQRTGRTFYYDSQIVATVKNKNVEKFKEELETMQARIRNDIETIFRQAEPSHFQEPTLATLTRQIQSRLDDRFGEDPDGEPMVQQVVISRCHEYRGD